MAVVSQLVGVAVVVGSGGAVAVVVAAGTAADDAGVA